MTRSVTITSYRFFPSFASASDNPYVTSQRCPCRSRASHMTCACSCSSSTTSTEALLFVISLIVISLCQRQSQCEIAALPQLARNRQRPAVLLRDAFGHRQTQPGAALARGIVGLEHLGGGLGWDAAAGVDYIDQRILGAIAREGQHQLAPPWHRLNRIEHQVQHGLLDQLGIHRRDNRLGGLAQPKLHMMHTGLWRKEIDQL